jgi:ESS family glutamate:Na+ symporter
MSGIAIRNFMPLAAGTALLRIWPGVGAGLSLLSDISLGLFLTMALMGLQLWELNGVFAFIVTVLTVQIALTILFTIFIVFPAMGRDYEAAVISASFGGITLGSTATAIANMAAVTQQYGAAHKAFVIVPLVCGFFIDLVNAFVIATFVG